MKNCSFAISLKTLVLALLAILVLAAVGCGGSGGGGSKSEIFQETEMHGHISFAPVPLHLA